MKKEAGYLVIFVGASFLCRCREENQLLHKAASEGCFDGIVFGVRALLNPEIRNHKGLILY
jgi:hypothetical protein